MQTGPVTEPERIHSLDALRGFALLGILVMNIQAFSMPFSAYPNPTNYGDLTGANFAVWLLSHVFTDQKFMTIFSMLFGAGVVLMTTRVAARGDRPARRHYRRMLWLLLFGMLHGYLLWFGDILFLYAVCGMIVYPFRKLSARKLLIIGLLGIAVASAISLVFGLTMPYWPEREVANMENEMWSPPPEKLGAEVATYRGGWFEQMMHRVPTYFQLQTFFTLIFFWRPAGLMLVGMALYKWGVLSAERSRDFYARWIAVAALVGVPVILYGVQRNFATGWNVRQSMFLISQYNYWGSLLVSMGWVGLLMVLYKASMLQRLMEAFAAVGRMAFTNYLLQTILCTTIFYGHGLGLYGSVPRVGQIGVVFGMWALQLIISPIWLRYFHAGPFEWIWRSLTYGARPPFRRMPAVAPASA